MATVAELDAQWETQYQVLLAKRQELTTAQTALALSAAYQNASEAERAELAKSGPAEAARLAFNQENQKLTAIKKELDLAKAVEAKDAADKAAALEAAKPESTVKTSEATNESKSDQTTTSAYADPSKIPDPVQTFDDGSSIQTFDDGSTLVTDSEGKLSSTESTDSSPRPALLSAAGTPISRGAESTKSKGASAQWGGAKDLRVYLRVPGSYLSGQYTSSLQEFAGIMFPYTPEISYDNQASYSAVNPVHTNYTQYFFKNSSVGPITVTGKFTVQNEKEAIIYLSVVHLLRSLTKMRWGSDEAPNAGAPPPVCRFEGYGDFMLRNVPVVLASFKTDFPNTVDYISVNSGAFKTSLVPTISSISLTLNPMYSRKEIQDFSVSGWLSGNLKGKGYL
jgi:hypothetical protein